MFRMMNLFLILPLIFFLTQSEGVELEERVTKLETYIEQLEPLLVKKYGLQQRCMLPTPANGRAVCSSDQFKAGDTCRVVCDSGYMVTPGRHNTTCLTNGTWNRQLNCEIPVVILSGGHIDESVTDSSVEILDLHNDKKCKSTIPDMPMHNQSNIRTFHNLLYDPIGLDLLACNGLSSESSSSCDSWSLYPAARNWQNHSIPHKGEGVDMAMDDLTSKYGKSTGKRHPHVDKGRYAAVGLTFDHRPLIIGGMVYDNSSHVATNTSRIYSYNYLGCKNKKRYYGCSKKAWVSQDPRSENKACQMKTPRAFFCAVKIDEYAVVMIGGFTSLNKVTKSVEFDQCKDFKEFKDDEYKYKWHPKPRKPNGRNYVSELPMPLSGHDCTLLPHSRQILVAGGHRFEGDQTQTKTFVYSWSNKSWMKQSDLTEPRFGHKIVTVGDRIFAIGGRNRETILDSIEEYDVATGKWKESDMKLNKPRAHFGLALVPRSVIFGSPCG